MIRRVAGGVLVALLLASCSSSKPASRSEGRPSGSPATATEPPPPTEPTTPAYPVFEAATAQVPRVPVFDAPNSAEPTRFFASPNPLYGGGTYRVFLVKENLGDWLNVYLPARPNGSTGWIRASDVSLQSHSFRMVIELGERRLTAFDKGEVLLQESIAVGRSATPSTLGTFYTTELLTPIGQPEYGPYAWGLSAYSEVLFTFGSGDGQMGIHGTNDPSSIGRDVSNGCIRLTNEAITKLVELLPHVGVPVEIKA